MKILVISDTHFYHDRIIIEEEVDTIIHCGDFTSSIRYNEDETLYFLDWFSSLKIKNKILIAGNHEAFLYKLHLEKEIHTFFKEKYPNITYLEDSSVVIDGIKFYGSPWTIEYCNWYFMCKNEEVLAKKFKNIDLDTNVLITHSPAYKKLDYAINRNVGSIALEKQIKKLLNLKLHTHGHTHESYGILKNDKYTTINAAFINYLGFTKPIKIVL